MRKKEFDMTANEVVKQMRARGYSTSSIESFVGYALTVSMRFPDRDSDIAIAVAMRGYNDSLEHLGRAP